jgi:hypothetical protein
MPKNTKRNVQSREDEDNLSEDLQVEADELEGVTKYI